MLVSFRTLKFALELKLCVPKNIDEKDALNQWHYSVTVEIINENLLHCLIFGFHLFHRAVNLKQLWQSRRQLFSGNRNTDVRIVIDGFQTSRKYERQVGKGDIICP
jgi:hypothetical protein